MIKSETVKIRGQQSFRKFKDKSKPSANKFINKKDTVLSVKMWPNFPHQGAGGDIFTIFRARLLIERGGSNNSLCLLLNHEMVLQAWSR